VAAEAFMVNVLDPNITSQLRGLAQYRPEFSAAT
jgi:hypothetical protein